MYVYLYTYIYIYICVYLARSKTLERVGGLGSGRSFIVGRKSLMFGRNILKIYQSIPKRTDMHIYIYIYICIERERGR